MYNEEKEDRMMGEFAEYSEIDESIEKELKKNKECLKDKGVYY